jgi:hypothetical protein
MSGRFDQELPKLCQSRHQSFMHLAQVSTLLNRHVQKLWLSLREALVLAGTKWTPGSVVIEMLPSPVVAWFLPNHAKLWLFAFI